MRLRRVPTLNMGILTASHPLNPQRNRRRIPWEINFPLNCYHYQVWVTSFRILEGVD
jgi:hypothetical protein